MEPRGGRRRGWKGGLRAWCSFLCLSIQPPGAAEDALVADGLWALSPALNPLTGCQGEVTSAGDDTGNRSSVHTGL